MLDAKLRHWPNLITFLGLGIKLFLALENWPKITFLGLGIKLALTKPDMNNRISANIFSSLILPKLASF